MFFPANLLASIEKTQLNKKTNKGTQKGPMLTPKYTKTQCKLNKNTKSKLSNE